ncbi:MAG: hypothetical protein QXZ09_06145 [Candidatus Methanomethylicaceae archaeon]
MTHLFPANSVSDSIWKATLIKDRNTQSRQIAPVVSFIFLLVSLFILQVTVFAIPPESPIAVKLSVKSLPKLNTPINISVEVTSKITAPHTLVEVFLEKGISSIKVAGWFVDLKKDQPVSLSSSLTIKETGNWTIKAAAIYQVDAKNSWGNADFLYFHISNTLSFVGFLKSEDFQRELAEKASTPASPAFAVKQPDPKGEQPPTHSLGSDDLHGIRTMSPGYLTVKGYFYYYDRNDNFVPAKYVWVQLWDADYGISGDDFLGEDLTDESGYFEIKDIDNCDGFGCALGTQDIYLQFVLKTTYRRVETYSGAVYSWYTNPVDNVPDGPYNFGVLSVPNGSNNEGAMWIFQDLRRAWEYPPNNPGLVIAEWENDGTSSSSPCGSGGNYYCPGEHVHLTGPAMNFSDTIIHEAAHNFQWNIYGFLPPGPNCNPHWIDVASSQGCAWVEGWADFYPLAVNNDPVYNYIGGNIDLESPVAFQNGDAVEGRVAGALWDIFDGANDGLDRYSEGFSNIWNTIFSQTDNTFFEFWADFRNRTSNRHLAVQALYQNTIDYNDPPQWLPPLPDQTITNASLNIDLWLYISDDLSQDYQLQFSVLSYNSSCISVGIASSRYLQISPSNGNCSSSVTVQASDGIETALDTFIVTVNFSDTTPPTPNPMTWASLPNAISASQISMTATTATDAHSPPVQYYFDETTGRSGGTDSGWQSSSSYTDGGLLANTQYCYQVRARDSASPPNETSPSSNVCRYTHAITPAAPVVSNPTTNSLDVDVNPNGNPGNTEFAIYNETSGYYINAAGGSNGSTPFWQTDAAWGNKRVIGLNPGTTYTFRVKARNGDGVETGFGPAAQGTTQPQNIQITVQSDPSGRTITVNGVNYTAPYSFTCTPGSSFTVGAPSPQPGGAGTQYVFNYWSDGKAQNHNIDCPSSNATYTAYFITQYSLTTSANPSAGGSVSPSGTNWYNSGTTVQVQAAANPGWQFIGWSGDASGTQNPINVLMNAPKNITANFNRPPNQPSNPSPPHNATNVDINADLGWSGGDPDGDPVTYDLYFGTSSPPPLRQAGLTTTSYDPGTLPFNTTHYWKIIARDNRGASTEGPIWSFTTASCPTPAAPTLNDPGQYNNTGNYTVNWSLVTGATSYTLEEDDNASFSSPTTVYTGSGTSKNFSSQADGTYYYRVKATNSCGDSAWSNVVDIIVDKTTPTDPTLSSSHPINTPSNDNTVQVTLSGAADATSGVDGYGVAWDNSPTWACDRVLDYEETITTIESNPLPDGNWWFHLCTKDNAGNWTSTVHLGPFIIDTTAPNLITNFTATAGNQQCSLAWTNPSNNDLAEVLVKRKVGSYPANHNDGDTIYNNSAPTPGGNVNYTDSNLTNDTTYYYAAFSRDTANNWNDTVTPGRNAAACTPRTTPNNPPNPTNPRVSPSSGPASTLFSYAVDVNDPEGNTVTVTLETFDPSDGIWEPQGDRQVNGNGTASWSNLQPFEPNDEGQTAQFRFHYNDGTNTGTWGPFEGPVLQQFTGPLNDNFSNAQVISGSAGTVTGSNVGATKEPCEPNHYNIPGGASVWYRWTAPASGNATFDTFGSDFDTILAVYTGDNLCNLAHVAGNDDWGGGWQSQVIFYAVAGTTYHIAVDGYGGFGSSTVLNSPSTDKVSIASVAQGNIVLNWNSSMCTGVTVTSSPQRVSYRPTATRPSKKTITVRVTNRSGGTRVVTDIVPLPEEPFIITRIRPSLPKAIPDKRLQIFTIYTEVPAGSPPVTATKPYFLTILDCGAFTTASEPQSLVPLQVHDVQVESQGDQVHVEAAGTGIASVRLQLYDLTGRLMLDEESQGDTLTLPSKTAQGRALANGVYLYVVHVRGYNGREYVSEVRKLVILH